MSKPHPKKRVHIIDGVYVTVEESTMWFGVNKLPPYTFRIINQGLVIGEFHLLRNGRVDQVYPDFIYDNFGKGRDYEVSNTNRS